MLHFHLHGTYDAATGSVSLTKRYLSRDIPEWLYVAYEGKVSVEAADGSGEPLATADITCLCIDPIKGRMVGAPEPLLARLVAAGAEA